MPWVFYNTDRFNEICSLHSETFFCADTRIFPVWSLGWEDSLEKEVSVHSSILAWEIPWTGVWWATVYGVAKSQQTRLSHSSQLFSWTQSILSPTWACSSWPCYNGRVDHYPILPLLEFSLNWSKFSILLIDLIFRFKFNLSFKFWKKLLSRAVTVASGSKHILRGKYAQ